MNNIYGYTLPFANFLGDKVLKMNNAQPFCLGQEMHNIREAMTRVRGLSIK